MIDFDDIKLAAERLAGVVRPTTVVPLSAVSRIVDRSILAKPEHLQKTGSFKIRGAYNRIAVMAEGGSAQAVVAASAGNHGQCVALAAVSYTHLVSGPMLPSASTHSSAYSR